MPRADHPPAFMFYPQDFASDSKVEAMSTEAVGAYILLLCKAWREEPPGSLPDSDDVLARWARMNLDRWTEIRSTVLAPFTLGTDSRWHQKRMRHEYSQLIKRRKVRAKAGQVGASIRWQSHSKRITEPIARNEYEGETETENLFQGELPSVLDCTVFRKSLAAWLSYKSERRQTYKPAGLAALITRAMKLASVHGIQAVTDAMERAAANRWEGWDHQSQFTGRNGPLSRVGPGQTHDPEASKRDPNHGRM